MNRKEIWQGIMAYGGGFYMAVTIYGRKKCKKLFLCHIM